MEGTGRDDKGWKGWKGMVTDEKICYMGRDEGMKGIKRKEKGCKGKDEKGWDNRGSEGMGMARDRKESG